MENVTKIKRADGLCSKGHMISNLSLSFPQEYKLPVLALVNWSQVRMLTCLDNTHERGKWEGLKTRERRAMRSYQPQYKRCARWNFNVSPHPNNDYVMKTY
jgi:hypothetical protein